MEWTTVTVIIALAGLGGVIVKPIVNLTQSITRLTVVVNRLQEDIEVLTTKNSEGHHRIWLHSGTQDQRLENHERRIESLERQ